MFDAAMNCSAGTHIQTCQQLALASPSMAMASPYGCHLPGCGNSVARAFWMSPLNFARLACQATTELL